ncbi:SDR family NAD(P)-dependent oxidoreductase, partial [Mesorhizobium sp. M00.F.Ca.ET.186.01.1.1]
MEKLLNNQVALVTGAASGIGLEIARTFASEGAKVMLLDLNRDAAEQAALRLQNEGYEAVSVSADVTNEEQMQQSIQQAVQTFGKLDILVNNAGLQFVSPIEDFPTAKFEQMIRIMLTAPFIAIKHAFPIMKQQGHGRIINMASINGLIR